MRVGIRARLFSGFAVVIVLLGVVGAVGLTRLAQLSHLTTELYEKHTLGIGYIVQANVDLIASGRAEKNAILADDRAEVEQHAASARKFLAEVSKELDQFKTVVVLDEAQGGAIPGAHGRGAGAGGVRAVASLRRAS